MICLSEYASSSRSARISSEFSPLLIGRAFDAFGFYVNVYSFPIGVLGLRRMKKIRFGVPPGEHMIIAVIRADLIVATEQFSMALDVHLATIFDTRRES